uniref:Uncharacterized protein n=1 Tax=Eutreptiella gymnastica TaxID=73025 RepID=A0A7S1IRG5_9EUGL
MIEVVQVGLPPPVKPLLLHQPFAASNRSQKCTKHNFKRHIWRHIIFGHESLAIHRSCLVQNVHKKDADKHKLKNRRFGYPGLSAISCAPIVLPSLDTEIR